MSYLDVIGPGVWLEDELMEPATFSFFGWLLIFCFAAVILTILVLLIVMWVRSGNEKNERSDELTNENFDTEEP